MIVRIRPFVDVGKTSAVLAGTPKKEAIQTFEEAFASKLGSPFAAAVHQGRAALLLALKILGIGEGDEVIVQSHIFHVVIDAIIEVGARPVLVDSQIEDFNVSPYSITRAITSRTKAIIAFHIGYPCDIGEISDIARKKGCYLIENCAHSFGALYDRKSVGTFGDVSFFSFDVDKPFTTGDGGMLVVNNPDFIEKAKRILSQYERVPLEEEKKIICGLLLHHYVTHPDFYPRNGFLPIDFGKKTVKADPKLSSLLEIVGSAAADINFKENIMPYLDNHELMHHGGSWIRDVISKINGKITVTRGVVKLPKIDDKSLLMNSLRSSVGMSSLADYDRAADIRSRNAGYYAESLDTAYKLPQSASCNKPAFLRYIVLNNTKYTNSGIAAMGRERGFELGIFNWSAPIHLCYPYEKILSFDRAKLRNSECLGERMLSLPNHPYVAEGTVREISEFLNGLAA